MYVIFLDIFATVLAIGLSPPTIAHTPKIIWIVEK